LSHFSDEGLRRPDILALAAKVECLVDDGIERDWSRNISPADLIVEVGNTTFRHRADYPRGHVRYPMTAADFDSKLDDCMTFGALTWPPGTAGALRETIGRLEDLEHANGINSILTSCTMPRAAGES
jgi:2-methylcitrate dehydratase PrpD